MKEMQRLPVSEWRNMRGPFMRVMQSIVAANLMAVLLCGCGAGVRAPDRIAADEVFPAKSSRPAQDSAAFDADRAFSLLAAQVAFGPRAPNSPGHAACRKYLIDEMRSACGAVRVQNFVARYDRRKYAMTNILGLINPAGTSKLLLGAHWDTRPVADRDPEPANRNKPIPGANDGASGVAVLLELARVLAADPAKCQVLLVLFDGEDFGKMFYGSTYFATHMGEARPDAAIILDMIGDSELCINRDSNSVQAAPTLYDSVLTAAAALGYADYFNGPSLSVVDDHIPLIKEGVPSIDLIDFAYPDASNRYWHTLDDTVDKCSPHSLGILGETVLQVVRGFSGSH